MFLWDELRGLPRPILIYGMGNGADKILALCREYGISIAGMFSSDTHAREGMFQGLPGAVPNKGAGAAPGRHDSSGLWHGTAR